MSKLYRLGIATKLLGTQLRSHDSRRWQNRPHLSVSLAYLRDTLEYLHSRDIHFYRLSSQLAPYATHPDMPQFHDQIDECSTELADIGDLARLYNIRLSMHPLQYVRLNSPDEERVQRSREELVHQAKLLEAMGADKNAVIVLHAGGAYNDAAASSERFVRAVDRLPNIVRERLVLENDDRSFDLLDCYWIHQRTGLPLVLDVLHHRCLNRRDIPIAEALALALHTWPPHQKPKLHFSSSRTELRRLRRNGEWHLQMPLINQHSDFIEPFSFIDFLRLANRRESRIFDIMLEAKARDLALTRIRQQVERHAPDLSELLG